MTTYTTASDGTTTYTVQVTETIWDDGLTFWDLSGNVYTTLWDHALTDYTTATDGTTTWT